MSQILDVFCNIFNFFHFNESDFLNKKDFCEFLQFLCLQGNLLFNCLNRNFIILVCLKSQYVHGQSLSLFHL